MTSTIQTPPPQDKAISFGSTRDKCHYSRSQFFKFDPEQGSIQDFHHQRNLLVGEDFIVSLLKGLEHEVGEASGWLLYQIGFDWGKQDAVLFKSWFKEFYNLTIETSNLAFALETWWWPYTVQGWGTWSPNLTNRESGFFYVDLFDSAVAKSLGYVGKPVCHLYSGLLAGFFSAAFEQNLCSTEIQWVMIFVGFWWVPKTAFKPLNFGFLLVQKLRKLLNVLMLAKLPQNLIYLLD
jgi:uncharacterized protein